MTALADAFVQVSPDTRGFGPALDSQVSGAAGSAGDRAGRSFSTRFGTAVKIGSTVIAAYAAKAAGSLLGMGIAADASNEQAEISFTTMLGSAKKADAFLRQLKDFAASTPFEFPELQTAASSLISAGINAKKVIPIMTTLGDVTSGMGTGSEGVRRATIALQQMNAAGRITAEDLNQLRDAGIPVYDLLAAATGKSKAEVVGLAQAGKLGKTELDQLMKALESGQGLERFSGLMDKQSQSVLGLWSTLKDAVRGGMAQLMNPLRPLIKDLLRLAIEVVGKNLPLVVTHMRSFAAAAREAFTGTDWNGASSGASAVGEAFRNLGPGLKDAAKELPSLNDLLTVGATAISFFGDHADLLAKALPFLVAGFAAFKAAQAAANTAALLSIPVRVAEVLAIRAQTKALQGLASATALSASSQGATAAATNLSTLAMARQKIAAVAAAVAQKVVAVATKAWAIAQRVLNLALTMNPIGLVIAAIGLLVVGLIVAYKKSDTFRRIVQLAFSILKTQVVIAIAIAKAAIDALRDKFAAAVEWFTGFKDKVKAVFTGAKTWLLDAGRNIIQGLLDGIEAMVGKVKDKLHSLTKMLPDWKGPESLDRKILVQPGRRVMAGFLDGLRSQWPAIQDQLGQWHSGLSVNLGGTGRPGDFPGGFPGPAHAAGGYTFAVQGDLVTVDPAETERRVRNGIAKATVLAGMP